MAYNFTGRNLETAPVMPLSSAFGILVVLEMSPRWVDSLVISTYMKTGADTVLRQISALTAEPAYLKRNG